ncbi:hypothetical protein [Actinospica robiniae]|uniref:hypothetical protein n=1 Tax=Actinospica robiniae TaxID=304901 RepID=UPI00041DA048|nr:hypothetical protein [Actinospica robiniae]
MARKLIAASTAAGLALALAAPARAAAAGWNDQPLPFSSGNILAVTNVDAHTVWAAGFTLTIEGEGESFSPLVLCRNGSGKWQVVQTPATGDIRADAISADGPNDVWVTGDSNGDGHGPLTEHWDGKAWTVVSAPLPAAVNGYGELLGVVALGENNAWAVGNGQYGATLIGVIDHWDGKSWQPSALPAGVADDVVFNTVTATGPHDLWAAGQSNATGRPVLLHGDGEFWQQIDVPTEGALYAGINALSADGSGGMWMVGTASLTGSDWGHPLVEHWNAGTWESTPVPPGSGSLLGAAVTAQGLAVVGYIPGDGIDAYGEVLHDGAWQPLNLPEVGDGVMSLNAVTTTRAGLLAVGGYSPNGDDVSEAPMALQQSNR